MLLWRGYLVFHGHVELNRTYMASDTRVDSILFGCALAVWRNPVLDPPTLNERRWKYGYAPAAAVVLLVCLFIRGDLFRETLRYSLQGAALTVIFVAAIAYPRWAAFAWLNTPVSNFLGLLSYSLYLVHLAVLMGIERALPTWHPVLPGHSVAGPGRRHLLVDLYLRRKARRPAAAAPVRLTHLTKADSRRTYAD